MKKKWLSLIHLLLSLFIAVFMANSGFSQSPYSDSLVQVIAGQPDNTEKADNLVKLTRYYIMINRDSSWYYCEKAYSLANQLNYTVAKADALYMKSILLKWRGNIQEALSYNERFLLLGDSLNDSVRLAKGNLYHGNLLTELLEFDKALDHFGKSLALYLDLNDTDGIVANYNSIGSAFSRKSDYDSSAIYYLKAVSIYEKTGKDKLLGVLLNNLSDVYLELGQLEVARKYAYRSKEINTKYDNVNGMAMDFIILGRIFSEEDDFNGALDNYRQADSLYNQIGDYNGISEIQTNIGVIYLKQKNYLQAIQYFNKALEGYRKMEYNRGIIVALGNKAAVYCEQGRYQEALDLYDTVLFLSLKHDCREYRKDALWNISDTYQKTGNYQKAFEYMLRFNKLKDSLFDIKKTKVINDLSFKYEKEKDQAHILALEKEGLQKDLSLRKRTSQRNAYLFTGVGIIALTVFLLMYFRQRAVKDKIIIQQKIRQLEEEKKMMAAKLLVEGQEEERKRIATELHDGLGVLLSATKMQFSIISDKSPENKVLIDKASRMLEQATGDVRKISHNMMPGLLTKLGFFEAVEGLFEDIGDTGDLNATCTITGNQDRLTENKEIMLFRIIQEMVNNTIKHAEARNIELQIHVLPEMLDIKYADDGKGFDIGQKLETESIGLKSIQSRVNFLNGKLTVESKPGEGVKYTMQIPA